MALGFFRRRQKMVIIIMVALMVSFLVGFQGFSMLLESDPAKEDVARTRFGEMTRGEFWSAQADLDILSSMGMVSNPWQFPEFYLLRMRNGEQAREAYALLLQEARHVGVLAGEGDVDAFFARLGYTGENYNSLISTLRASQAAWPESRIRQAVRDYVLIGKAFSEFRVNCPPSERQAAVAFRDFKEEIKVRFVRLKAADYLKEVPDPNDKKLQEHFNLYRTRFPDQTRNINDMGFGYRQPARAQVQYLFIRGDAIRRISMPSFSQVHDYFKTRADEFTKKVPATAPAGGSATQPSTQPMREVPMTFAEAKERIVEKLRAEVAAGRMDELARFLEDSRLRELAKTVDPNGLYAAARDSLLQNAEKPLATMLRGVKIDDLPLDEAVARLAEAAKLQAICYPWGTHGSDTLLPTVKVSLQADGITLGEALEKVSQQAKWPPAERGKLRWATCEGFGGVLFSVGDASGGVDFFPVQVAQTDLMTIDELGKDPVLGYASANPAGGMGLPKIVFSAKGLSTEPGEKPQIEVGKAGPRMYILGDKPGRLLWRLVEALPARSPMGMDEAPGLRQKVVDELKLTEAFKKAVEDGQKLKKGGEDVGLDLISGARKMELTTTGFFPRQTVEMQLPNVPEFGLGTPELRAYAITQAFTLVPDKPNPPPGGKPAIAVAPMPIEAEVLVMERVGYRPVVRPEYEEYGRIATAQLLHQGVQRQLEAAWFDLRAITVRVKHQWLK